MKLNGLQLLAVTVFAIIGFIVTVNFLFPCRAANRCYVPANGNIELQ